jgi:glycosyltransferase involved in cell wall biosynthesis
MSELRVLNILNELKPSGAEVMICNARDYWKKLNITHEILATAPSAGIYASEFEKAGFKVFHYPKQLNFSFYKKLYRLIKNNRYDIIHIHTEASNFNYGMLSRLAGVKTVRSIHNCFDFTGLSRMKRILGRQTLRFFGTANIAVSDSAKEVEMRCYGNPSVAIPNWYDHNKFYPVNSTERSHIRQELGIPEKTLVFITLANCNHAKNHSELIRAFAQVKDEVDFIYIHAGGEEEKKGFPERKLAAELGIIDRIRFLGFVNNAPQLLHASDFYVMPSLFEGLGNASLEALACGIPSILTDVAGSRDLKFIKGTFWAKPEAASLADLIRTVSNFSSQEREDLGQQAHQMIREHFGIERGVQAYANIYHKQKGKEAYS